MGRKDSTLLPTPVSDRSDREKVKAAIDHLETRRFFITATQDSPTPEFNRGYLQAVKELLGILE